MDSWKMRSIFGPLVDRVRDVPKTRESLFSYVALILYIVLIGWLILAGFFTLFRVNIFWDTVPLAIFITLAVVGLVSGIYASHLNMQRQRKEEHDRMVEKREVGENTENMDKNTEMHDINDINDINDIHDIHDMHDMQAPR